MWIAFALFILLAIGFFAVAASVDQRSDEARILRARLESVRQAEARKPSEELALLRDELLSTVPALNKWLSRSSHIIKLNNYLLQAQITMRPGKFILLSAVVGAALAAITLQFAAAAMFSPLSFAVGAICPFLFVSFKRNRRFRAFESKFPEAIELLARSVRAGHAFSSAIETIGLEMSEPVAGEFRTLYEEQKFGLPMRDALLNLAERVPIVDVQFFVTSVLLQRETGGNLAEILDKLAYVIRERFKILRQVRVYTAQGRLTMMILCALPPGLFFVLMLVNPEFMRPLLNDPLGHRMIWIAVVMQVMGFFFIRKVIRIKV
ncbi:MAG TPA: type II secretion system F family protein [Terriglobales bacterium]